jgi:large subunit ribosomal protein L22
MAGKARVKYIRMSPRKVSLVLDLIRGKTVSQALTALTFLNRRAADPVRKVLESAVANGNASDSTDQVRVTRAWVGQGPQLKRMRPRAMGRADIYRRKTSHIEIEIG